MFLPSTRVWNEMNCETSGFWPVPINSGDEHAFLLQTQTHLIKSAYRSCPVTLTVSTTATPLGSVLATVLKLADDPISPFTLTGVHRHDEEQVAVEKILRAGHTLMVFLTS